MRINWKARRKVAHTLQWGGLTLAGSESSRRLVQGGGAAGGGGESRAASSELRKRLLATDGASWADAFTTLDRFDTVIRNISVKYAPGGEKGVARALDGRASGAPASPIAAAAGGGTGSRALLSHARRLEDQLQWGSTRGLKLTKSPRGVAAAAAELAVAAAALAIAHESPRGPGPVGDPDSEAVTLWDADSLSLSYARASPLRAGDSVLAAASAASLAQLRLLPALQQHAPGYGASGARNAPSALAVSLRASMPGAVAPRNDTDESNAVAYPTHMRLLRVRLVPPRKRAARGAAPVGGPGEPGVGGPAPAVLATAMRRHRRAMSGAAVHDR